MLEGKTALITGSTSGIGRSIANSFAQNGANIIITGFANLDDIESFRKELKNKYNTKSIYFSADLTILEEIEKLINHSLNFFNTVDILINNAGVQHISSILDFPSEKWNQIIAINLTAAFHTIRLVAPGMLQNKWGRIINISSAHGLVASPLKSAYVAAKHGLIGLTKTAALEFANNSITVNAIAPGFVMTPLIENQIPDLMRAKNLTRQEVIEDIILSSHPTKEFVTKEQIAELAIFLASEHAASITGSTFSIDSGWTAR